MHGGLNHVLWDDTKNRVSNIVWAILNSSVSNAGIVELNQGNAHSRFGDGFDNIPLVVEEVPDQHSINTKVVGV
jgi:hypothetical protein